MSPLLFTLVVDIANSAANLTMNLSGLGRISAAVRGGCPLTNCTVSFSHEAAFQTRRRQSCEASKGTKQTRHPSCLARLLRVLQFFFLGPGVLGKSSREPFLPAQAPREREGKVLFQAAWTFVGRLFLKEPANAFFLLPGPWWNSSRGISDFEIALPRMDVEATQLASLLC